MHELVLNDLCGEIGGKREARKYLVTKPVVTVYTIRLPINESDL